MARGKGKASIGSTSRIKGCMYIGAPANTSNVGAFTGTRYEIDTSLSQIWSQFGALFQKWKIHNLQFEFVPIQGIAIVGTVMMALIEDPDSTTPTSIASCLNSRIAQMWRYNLQQRMILNYTPPNKTILGNGWMYTQDNLTGEDRFEMPADFIVGTSDFVTDVSPGHLICHYDVSFAQVVNSSVSLSKSVTVKKEEEQPRKIVAPDLDIYDVPTGFKLVRLN